MSEASLPPQAVAARELFTRHARRDGRSVAVLRALDYGDFCLVEAAVYPQAAAKAEPQRAKVSRGTSGGSSDSGIGASAAWMISASR